MAGETDNIDVLEEEAALLTKKAAREGNDINDSKKHDAELSGEQDGDTTAQPNEKEGNNEALEDELTKLKQEILHNAGFKEDGSYEKRLGFLGGNPKNINVQRALKIDMSKINKSKNPKEALRNETGRQEKLLRNGVESVVTNLAHTLGNVGLDAIEQYKQNPEENYDYLQVAQTVNQLALALQETGKGTISFKRDTQQEEGIRRRRRGDGTNPPDQVYIYQSDPIEIDGKKFESIQFFIRPSKYKREFKSKSGGTGYETRQERTNITVTSPDLPLGVASIRIDPPSKYSKKHITFDVIVGGDESNVIEALDLSSAGQEAGHHFTSEFTANDLQLEPSQIHEGIAARLDALTKSDNREITTQAGAMAEVKKEEVLV